MAIIRGDVEHISPGRVLLAGNFSMGTASRSNSTRDKSYYEMDVAAGANIVFEAVAGGSAGDDLDVAATADGTAKASLDLDAGLNVDTVIEAATGGVGGNDWSISIIGGAAAKAGVAFEDTPNKILTCMMQLAVSDVNDLETLITASTALAVKTGGTGANVIQAADVVYDSSLVGGTAVTWAEETGAPSETILHFTAASTTVAQACAALNAVSSGDQLFACRPLDNGAGAAVLAGGDAVLTDSTVVGSGTQLPTTVGEGYSVQKTGVAEYTITLEDLYTEDVVGFAELQLNAVDDKHAEIYTVSASQMVVKIFDVSGGVVDDVALHANNRIHFMLLEKNTGAV